MKRLAHINLITDTELQELTKTELEALHNQRKAAVAERDTQIGERVWQILKKAALQDYIDATGRAFAPHSRSG